MLVTLEQWMTEGEAPEDALLLSHNKATAPYTTSTQLCADTRTTRTTSVATNILLPAMSADGLRNESISLISLLIDRVSSNQALGRGYRWPLAVPVMKSLA